MYCSLLRGACLPTSVAFQNAGSCCPGLYYVMLNTAASVAVQGALEWGGTAATT